ncbi:MAG: hypothetical protein RO257_16270 [Candidatus Kapabacteria bacterium]|nr:hypothetical protein [Candidatus Kapabacteria bacterium]
MKKAIKNIEPLKDDLLPEYEIDYSKVKRNPYYRKNRTFIEIDEDVAKIFQTSANINKVLKAIANSIPSKKVVVL